MENTNTLLVYCDGGARGNPGPAAIGVSVLDNSKTEILALGKKIGETTNNVAEYKAVELAFESILEQKLLASTIRFFLDSRLVVNQLKGLFKIKNQNLKQLAIRIKKMEQQTQASVTYFHIPREQNTRADFLVNQALDAFDK